MNHFIVRYKNQLYGENVGEKYAVRNLNGCQHSRHAQYDQL